MSVSPRGLLRAYRLRWKRRRFLFRIWRKRRQITVVSDRRSQIRPNAILGFATVRNEMVRLPYFLAYYRKLGVEHFLIVDNDSDDGTTAYLAAQPDVSLWLTKHSYRLSRFGMDWLGWLQCLYGAGHWCLTVDADELLAYPDCETMDLQTLTAQLDAQGLRSFGALMLDLYPQGPLEDVEYTPGDDPTKLLCWFDADNYHHKIHAYYGNQWVQGGVRERVFFCDEPVRAPTLNKTPLVKWSRRFAYVSSTHQILPTSLHGAFVFAGGDRPSGVLLHTKFLPGTAAKSAEELDRKQHFQNTALYTDYHRALTRNPTLWYAGSCRYEGAAQLVSLGLMSKQDQV